jgi:type II secretory pathway pseudopilin PulG
MLVTIVTDGFFPMRRIQVQPENTRRTQSAGFTLVEALVVVMVILVIAAIAIPRFVQARMRANEASAVSSMHTIETSEILYSQSYPDLGYAKALIDMGTRNGNCASPTASNACLLMDDSLASGYKSGYLFQLTSDGQKPSRSYTLTAIPSVAGVSGRCSFSSDQGGEISFRSPGATQDGRFAVGGDGGGAGGCSR